jgi:hypothetical protein
MSYVDHMCFEIETRQNARLTSTRLCSPGTEGVCGVTQRYSEVGWRLEMCEPCAHCALLFAVLEAHGHVVRPAEGLHGYVAERRERETALETQYRLRALALRLLTPDAGAPLLPRAHA